MRLHLQHTSCNVLCTEISNVLGKGHCKTLNGNKKVHQSLVKKCRALQIEACVSKCDQVAVKGLQSMAKIVSEGEDSDVYCPGLQVSWCRRRQF